MADTGIEDTTMKSPMIERSDIPNKSAYSDLQVLQSAAGWYVGTMFVDPDDGLEEPGSRDSDYFPSRKTAEAYLAALEKSGAGVPAIVLRNHP